MKNRLKIVNEHLKRVFSEAYIRLIYDVWDLNDRNSTAMYYETILAALSRRKSELKLELKDVRELEKEVAEAKRFEEMIDD